MTIRTARGKFSVARAAVMLAEELRRAYDVCNGLERLCYCTT